MESLMKALSDIIPDEYRHVMDEVPKDVPSYLAKQVEWINATPGNLGHMDCPECMNRGYVARVGDCLDIVYRECRCMNRRRALMEMELSGMRSMLDRYTFDGYTTDEPWQAAAKQRVQKYAESPYGWLYMAGQSGCGKTHLCTAVCKSLIDSGREVRYIIWRDLLHELEGKRFKADEYAGRIDEIKRYEVLYVDDFLKSPDRAALAKQMDYAFEVINARYNNAGTITILSSELYLSDIEQLDPATHGRIKERCCGNAIQIRREDGRNYRAR